MNEETVATKANEWVTVEAPVHSLGLTFGWRALAAAVLIIAAGTVPLLFLDPGALVPYTLAWAGVTAAILGGMAGGATLVLLARTKYEEEPERPEGAP
jgi:hypothetical protein